MSDSDREPENGKSHRPKRGAVLKFQIDDSSSDDSQVAGPSNRLSKRSRKRLVSSDNDSSSDSDFTLASIRSRQAKPAKAIAPGDDSDESSDDSWDPQQNRSTNNGENVAQPDVIEDDESATDSDSSSSDSMEKCPICLHSFRDQEVGIPNVCEHDFCAPCIEEWSQNVQTCPIDRKPFTIIRIKEKYGGAFVRDVGVQKVEAEPQAELEFTNCEVCHRSDREEIMLLCDGCDAGYHMDCLVPALTEIPEGSWYCDNCFASDMSEDDLSQVLAEMESIVMPSTRLRIRREEAPRITRTRQSERIRATIRSRRDNATESTSSNPMPGTSRGSQRVTQTTTTTRTTTTTTRTTTTRSRAVKRKKRKTTKKRRPRTYIVEYDLDDYNNKFASTRRVIKRRKRRTNKKSSRKCSTRRRGGRSANDAGIEALAGGARGERLREHYPQLHLFGNRNALEYFSDDSNGGDEGPGSLNNSIDTGDGLMVRAVIRNMSNRQRLRCKNIGSIPSNPEGSTDILSNIMDTMSDWHSVSRPSTIEKIKINADGSLIFEKKGKKPTENERPPADPRADILNAPLYAGNGTTIEEGNQSFNDSNSLRGGNANQGAGDGGRIAGNARDSDQFQAARGGNANNANRTNFVSESFSFRNQNRSQLQRRRPDAQQSLYDGEDDLPIRNEPVEEPETAVDPDASELKEKASHDESQTNQNSPLEQTQEEQSPNCDNESSSENSPIDTPNEPTPNDSDVASNDQSTNDQHSEVTVSNDASKSNDFVSSDDEGDHAFEYSKESMQVATDSLDNEPAEESTQQEPATNDETLDNDEDLVQLDDDEHFGNETIDDTVDEQKTANSTNDDGSAIESPRSSPRSPDANEQQTNANETSANNEERSSESEDDGSNDVSAAGENLNASKTSDDNRSDQGRSDQTTGIEGMDTEMISDDENILRDDQVTKDMKADKENNNDGNEADESFKKVSKSNKERNYRDKKDKGDGKHRNRRSRSKSPARLKSQSSRTRSRSRSRSYNRNKNRDKNRDKDRDTKRKDKRRQEIQRYDVRTVIADRQPKQNKDKYGRDSSRAPKHSRSQSISPKRARSWSRSRSRLRSRSRTPRMRSRSITRSPTPARRRSVSRSSLRRRSISPRRRRSTSRSRRKRRSVSRSPIHFSHSHSRSRSVSPRHVHYHVHDERSRSRSRDRRSKKRTGDKRAAKIRNKKKATSSKKPYYSPVRRNLSPADQRRSVSKSWDDREREWNRDLSNEPTESWTPPIAHAPENLTVIVNNSKESKRDKKRDKKRKSEKRKDSLNKKEKRKRGDHSPANVPSKEVFASGDNILVSVSFNKEKSQPQQQTTIVTLPPTKEQILSKKPNDHRDDRSKRSRRLQRDGPRRHRKVDTKPVAIIDLDNSPFKEVTPSPKAVIVLSDSDQENDKPSKSQSHSYSMATNAAETESDACDNLDISLHVSSPPQSPLNDESFELSLGPKTPPEPHLVKFSLSTNMKTKLRTVINPLHDNDDDDEDDEDRMDATESNNDSNAMTNAQSETPPGPTSPDVYDPFEPTKSASQSPSDSEHTKSDEPKNDDTSKSGKSDLTAGAMLSAEEHNEANNANDDMNVSPYKEKSNEESTTKSSGIQVLSNILIATAKDGSSRIPSSQSGPSRTSTLTLPSLSTVNSLSPMKYGGGSIISKLPLPKMSKPMRHNGNDDDMEIASPYSPGADDYEDLFEPPMASPSNQQSSSSAHMKKHGSSRMPSSKPPQATTSAAGKVENTFDDLFGSMSPPVNKKPPKRRPSKHSSTIKGYGKLNEEQLRILDDVPGSAVELQNKDKFLRKLNRQERVIEEVKLVLKPHYNKKHVSKEEYKDIMRRAVPKICHNRTGEINPKKIKKLIEAYVTKFRKLRKIQQSGNAANK